jgi:uncharacterized protein (TIGR00251 family)
MSDDELVLREQGNAVYFDVRVTPRASRTAVAGVHAGALKLSVNAPPVDGAGNAAVIALLARCLGVNRRALRIVRGEHARSKTVSVEGLPAAQVREALGAAGS